MSNTFKGNGNKFKGNKAKKGARGRKNVYADFDPNVDQYAKIISIEGGKHMNVLPLDSADGTTVHATIRGIHHKKVWFKKDDYVVITYNGNIAEVMGKVNENDINRVRGQFDNTGDNKKDNIIFCDDEASDDTDEPINFDDI